MSFESVIVEAMKPTEIKSSLIRLGWPEELVDTQHELTVAIEHFQRGYARGVALSVDGIVGAKTEAAIRDCLAHDGLASKSFTWRQTASHGNGDIFPTRALLMAGDVLKAFCLRTYGSFQALSICRDPAWNIDQGGSTNPPSPHLSGEAIDFTPHLTVAQAKGLRVFIGLERWNRDGKIKHGDTATSRTRRGYSVKSPEVFWWPS